MIDAIGEDEVNQILSVFSCSKDAEIEKFIKKNAMGFAKRKMSVPYLVLNDTGFRFMVWRIKTLIPSRCLSLGLLL